MFPNTQAGSGAGQAAPATSANPSPAASTPPTSTQQPSVQQQQQPQPPNPYTYAPPPPQAYPLPFAFQLVPGHGPHTHHHHAHHPNSAAAGGAVNQGVAQPGAAGGASSLIDPMLSTMSDGGDGMSEDEVATNLTTGVKNGPSSGGNNGINHHQHDEDDFNPDDAATQTGLSSAHPGGAVGMGIAGPVDENGQPLKKKRRRQALSCTECKRRKIKCDRQNPCSPCTRRGEADRCRWITQEPMPDTLSPSSASEKFVTRAEYDVLQQKVAQLEALVASIAPRAFSIPGLEPLSMANLPLGHPFFPPPPHHPGGPPPQHHPYPGPPPNQPQQPQAAPAAPGQEGQYPPPTQPQPNAQEIQHAYQQHFSAYATAPQQQGQPSGMKPGESMEVDTPAQSAATQHSNEPGAEGQREAQAQQQPAAAAPPAAPATPAQPAVPSPVPTPEQHKGTLSPVVVAQPKAPKNRKRKVADVVDEEGANAHDSAAGGARGGGRGRSKPRSKGGAAAVTAGQPAGTWDAAASTTTAVSATAPAAATSGTTEHTADAKANATKS
ncbi:hypothetical protein FRB99_002457 [Tulasnella sp. 403]|nr:hypothetical protein FRB99_002457 [Tulasnella sp. 403]